MTQHLTKLCVSSILELEHECLLLTVMHHGDSKIVVTLPLLPQNINEQRATISPVTHFKINKY
jgi:hypothetical protein